MSKSAIWLGAGVGGVIGGYIPALWGDNSLLSPASILLGTIGGIAGIILVHRLYQA